MPNSTLWTLPSPELTAPPNVPADLQALANALDVRLGSIFYVTSTSRPAHRLGRVIYESDTKRLQISTGSAWVLLSTSDTDWVDITPGPNFVGVSGYALQARRIGAVTHLRGAVQFKTGQITGRIGTVPSGMRPTGTVYIQSSVANNGYNFHPVVAADGQILIPVGYSSGTAVADMVLPIAGNFVAE